MAVRARGGDVAGAMIVAHTDANRFSATEEQLLADIAGAGRHRARHRPPLPRRRARRSRARRRAEEVQRFYAETSAVLSLSLDYPESFEQLGRLCVPFLADLCLIDVAEEHGVRRFAAIHADPDKAGARRRARGEVPARPVRPRTRPRAWCAAASPSSPATCPTISCAPRPATSATTRSCKELEFTSYMCVPLEARGRVLGALTLVSSGSGRHFGDADLALAVEFARRAGLALDNARLYSERDHVARALQSSLLPPSLPDIPGVGVTARYRAAGEGNEVGGDFYHVFQVDEHAWWFAIGDVSGKGPEAAAIAGLSRAHAARARAFTNVRRASCSRTLHETLLAAKAHGEFCTVCCALLQPHDRRRHALDRVRRPSAADHPPRTTARSRSRTAPARCSACPSSSTFVEQSVELGPGDIVVLYTDGVTEAHHRNQPLFGEERLMDVIRRRRTTSTGSPTTSSPRSPTTARPSPVTTSRSSSCASNREPALRWMPR